MRIFFVILIFILNSFSAFSQGLWDWTTPQPLTDSVTNNTNPYLHVGYYDSYSLFMFWEKSVDSTSTAVYMDNLLDGSPEVVVLQDSGVHYSNPKVMTSSTFEPPPSDTLFYLFYETDQNGNKDIYYMAYLSDASFSEPIQFAISDSDDEQYEILHKGPFNKSMSPFIKDAVAWISDSILYVRNLIAETWNNTQYFSEPVIIDNSNCISLCLSYGFLSTNQENLVYTKIDSMGEHLYYSRIEGWMNWTDPEVYFDSVPSCNPSKALHFQSPCWSSYIDGSWTVLVNEHTSNSVIQYNISQDHPFKPVATGWTAEFYGDNKLYVAVTYPYNNVDEIFMTDSPGSIDFVNFSNLGTFNRKPRIFEGEQVGMYESNDYLLWESFRNGHWQIWHSILLQTPIGITESYRAKSYMTAYPNPFTNSTTIEYEITEPSYIHISIYNIFGEEIQVVLREYQPLGIHKIIWCPERLSPGVYYCVLRSKEEVSALKMIKQ